MKVLLILEFEMFIKKKQYIFPIAYLIFSIAYVLYMVKVRFSHDVFYMIFFTSQLINAFARCEQPMKGDAIKLFPIRAKTRVNTLFVEILILNFIILLGFLINYFSFHEINNMWFVLNIIVLNEAIVIPAILPVEIWHRNYFQHLGIFASCDWCCCTYLYKNKYSSYYSVFGICGCSLYASVHLIHSYLD